jgi:adenylate cyclase
MSTCAIASTDGVTRARCRHRDRNVIAMSSGSTEGAQSRNTVDGGGSSTTFSKALAAPSVSRSASSMTTTCHRPVLGRRDAIATMARISSTPIDRPSGTIRRTSACVPAIVVVQARHRPHPGTSAPVHCRAAAKHRAATERPDPGGPVINQACVMDPTSPAP